MKRLFFAAVATVALMSACNEKRSLAGAEFSIPNVMSDVADTAWAKFQKEMDYQLDSAKQVLVAQLEAQMECKLTDEELAQMDSSLAADMEEQYADARRQIDSLKNEVVLGFTFVFKDDQHVALKTDLKSDDGDDEDTQQGTYTLKDGQVVIDYGDKKDTLQLSEDGQELSGRFYENAGVLTLKRTK